MQLLRQDRVRSSAARRCSCCWWWRSTALFGFGAAGQLYLIKRPFWVITPSCCWPSACSSSRWPAGGSADPHYHNRRPSRSTRSARLRVARRLMPAAAHPSWLRARRRIGHLLAAGFAAGFHLAARRCGATPWPLCWRSSPRPAPWLRATCGRSRSCWPPRSSCGASPPRPSSTNVLRSRSRCWRPFSAGCAASRRRWARGRRRGRCWPWPRCAGLAILPLIWFWDSPGTWRWPAGPRGRPFQHARRAVPVNRHVVGCQCGSCSSRWSSRPVAGEEALFRGLLLPLLVRHCGSTSPA